MDKYEDGQHEPADIAPISVNDLQGESAAEEPMTAGQWWRRNAPILAIMVAGIVFLYLKFGLDPWTIAKVCAGLVLVVFIHELGHFLTAKWCDVHVTAFSIGFGPPIPGCSVKWGETTYKLCLIPLGGYVQMVGQVDGDESGEGTDEDPRSFRNKSVGQRMLIISAGVIMNVFLAIVCFIAVFRGPGKERLAAVIQQVDSGSQAFKSGIHTGTLVTQIGDVHNPYFDRDLMPTVMSSPKGHSLAFVTKGPGDKSQSLQIEPAKGPDDKSPKIGISPSTSLQLRSRKYSDPKMEHPAFLATAAAQAQPPFEFGDRIIAMTDPDDPAKKVTDLPDDPRIEQKGRKDYFAFARRMQLLADQSVTMRVLRGEGPNEKTVDVVVPPSYGYNLGARMQMGEIIALRKDGPAAKAGMHVRTQTTEGVDKGDRIVSVTISEDGKKTVFDKKDLDPILLPIELKRWAQRLDENHLKDAREVELVVRRQRQGAGQEFDDETVILTWDDDWRFDRVTPMTVNSPLAIPELGLAYEVKAIVEDASPDSQLKTSDVIQEILVTYDLPSDESPTPSWSEVKNEQWAMFSTELQVPVAIQKIELKVRRNKEIQTITMVPTIDKRVPLVDRGLILMPDARLQVADNTWDATVMGFEDTYDNVIQVFRNIRGMASNRIAFSNVGGPIMIGRVAYMIAGNSFSEFIFFLGLISVNLAVINFMPIPVLDGGHMVFLIYEKLRGKPASEAVRVGATYVGLALILCLMLFVFYLDLTRRT